MKKVLFTICIIAILVGVTFAGMAATQPPSAPPCNLGPITDKLNAIVADIATIKGDVTSLKSTMGTVNTNVAAIATDVSAIESDVASIETDLGNVLIMEAGSGNITGKVSSMWEYPVDRDHPQTRHVHLTYNFSSLNSSSAPVDLMVSAGNSAGGYETFAQYVTAASGGYYTAEFDADYWTIVLYNWGSYPDASYDLRYAWTETYTP